MIFSKFLKCCGSDGSIKSAKGWALSTESAIAVVTFANRSTSSLLGGGEDKGDMSVTLSRKFSHVCLSKISEFCSNLLTSMPFQSHLIYILIIIANFVICFQIISRCYARVSVVMCSDVLAPPNRGEKWRRLMRCCSPVSHASQKKSAPRDALCLCLDRRFRNRL